MFNIFSIKNRPILYRLWYFWTLSWPLQVTKRDDASLCVRTLNMKLELPLGGREDEKMGSKYDELRSPTREIFGQRPDSL